MLELEQKRDWQQGWLEDWDDRPAAYTLFLQPARLHPARTTCPGGRRLRGKQTCTGMRSLIAATSTPALQVIGHVAAFQLRQRQRFESYGPWPHAYGPMGQPNPP